MLPDQAQKAIVARTEMMISYIYPLLVLSSSSFLVTLSKVMCYTARNAVDWFALVVFSFCCRKTRKAGIDNRKKGQQKPEQAAAPALLAHIA